MVACFFFFFFWSLVSGIGSNVLAAYASFLWEQDDDDDDDLGEGEQDVAVAAQPGHVRQLASVAV